MEKLVKIISSPFNPNLEVFDEIVISLHVPYSDKDVTVQINPNIQDYKENDDKQGIQIRQMSVMTNNEDTKTLKFDFGVNNIHKFSINDKEYEIKLMQIGKENIQGQDFSFFEFNVRSEII